MILLDLDQNQTSGNNFLVDSIQCSKLNGMLGKAMKEYLKKKHYMNSKELLKNFAETKILIALTQIMKSGKENGMNVNDLKVLIQKTCKMITAMPQPTVVPACAAVKPQQRMSKALY